VVELPSYLVSQYQPDVPGISDRRTGLLLLFLQLLFFKIKNYIIILCMYVEVIQCNALLVTSYDCIGQLFECHKMTQIIVNFSFSYLCASSFSPF